MTISNSTRENYTLLNLQHVLKNIIKTFLNGTKTETIITQYLK